MNSAPIDWGEFARNFHVRRWAVVALAICFLSTTRQHGSILVPLNYCFLIAGVATGIAEALSFWPDAPKYVRFLPAIAAIAAAFIWYRFDSFERDWAVRDGKRFDGRENWIAAYSIDGALCVTEQVHRSGEPFYQSISQRNGGNDLTMEGPVSVSGKRHGEWKESVLGKVTFESRKAWYWYGEEVTEGEWHLRNK